MLQLITNDQAYQEKKQTLETEPRKSIASYMQAPITEKRKIRRMYLS